MLNVSRRTVQAAAKVKDVGAPELDHSANLPNGAVSQAKATGLTTQKMQICMFRAWDFRSRIARAMAAETFL